MSCSRDADEGSSSPCAVFFAGIGWASMTLASEPGIATAVLDALPDGLFVYRDDGRIVASNPAAVALSGYTSESLQHMPIQRLVPTERSTPRHGRYGGRGAPRRRQTIGDEHPAVLIRRDGSRLPVAITTSEVEIDGRLAVVADIRPALQARFLESLQQLPVSLSARTRERRAALQERRRYARVLVRDLGGAVDAVVVELHSAAAEVSGAASRAHIQAASEAADRLVTMLSRIGGSQHAE